jgi:hypothetical protein
MFTEGENDGVRLLSELTELVCCCHVDAKLTIALNKYFVARRGGFSGRWLSQSVMLIANRPGIQYAIATGKATWRHANQY